MHTPAWQVSTVVQALPSLQEVPSGRAGPVSQIPEEGLQVDGSWQSSGGGQTMGLPPVHAPVWQLSIAVQALPSSHEAPSDTAGPGSQIPEAGLQVEGSWHTAGGGQTTGDPPAQLPVWQLSIAVQALPSSHEAPSDTAGPGSQIPEAGLQVEGSWHTAGGGQTTGDPPAQLPVWQLSIAVQALPSSQGVPSGFSGAFSQPPEAGSHVPASWHVSGGWQTTGFPPEQEPSWQPSVCVQASPSSHEKPFSSGGFWQPPVEH